MRIRLVCLVYKTGPTQGLVEGVLNPTFAEEAVSYFCVSSDQERRESQFGGSRHLLSYYSVLRRLHTRLNDESTQ